MLAANGHAEDKGEVLQAALNVGHSLKVLASNLPCTVMNDKAKLSPGDVPALCIQSLSAGGGGNLKKTPAKSGSVTKNKVADAKGSAKRKNMRVEEEEEMWESEDLGDESVGGDDDDEEEEVPVKKSAKKSKSATPATKTANTPMKSKTPANTPMKSKTPGDSSKTLKTPGKTPKKTPGKTPK